MSDIIKSPITLDDERPLTIVEEYIKVGQFQLLMLKQTIIDVMEFLEDPKNKEKMLTSNFNLQPLCQKFGLKKPQLDIILSQILIIARAEGNKEFAEFVQKIKISFKGKVEHTFSKKAIDLDLAVEKMIFAPSAVNEEIMRLQKMNSMKSQELQEITHVVSSNDTEFDDNAIIDEVKEEDVGMYVSANNSSLYNEPDEFEFYYSRNMEEEEDTNDQKPKTHHLIEEEEELKAVERTPQAEVPKYEEAPQAKEDENQDDVIYLDEDNKPKRTNKKGFIKKIALTLIIVFFVVATVALLKHFGIIAKILGHQEPQKTVIKVEPSIPQDNIPSFKKAPLPNPSDSYKQAIQPPKADDMNMSNTVSMVPILPAIDAQKESTTPMPNTQTQTDQAINAVTQKVIEKEKQVEPTDQNISKSLDRIGDTMINMDKKPQTDNKKAVKKEFPITLSAFGKMFEQYVIKVLPKEDAISFDGETYKEGENFGENLRVIKVIDKNTVKMLDIKQNAVDRVTR